MTRRGEGREVDIRGYEKGTEEIIKEHRRKKRERVQRLKRKNRERKSGIEVGKGETKRWEEGRVASY